MSDKYIEITEDLKEVLLKHKDALNLTEDMCNEYPDSLICYIFFMNNIEDLNTIFSKDSSIMIPNKIEIGSGMAAVD